MSTSETSFQASPQQNRFFRWIVAGTGSVILEAVAGSGKTTTLIHGLGLMEGSVFFGAYNKKIADEIKAKADKAGLMRSGLFIGTMHSAGYSSFRRAYPKVTLDEKKVAKLIDEAATLGGNSLGPVILAYRSFIERMVSFGKQFLLGVKCAIDNKCIWTKLVQHFSADDDLPEGTDVNLVLDYVIEIYKRSFQACPLVIDFDDMIYAPIAYNCRVFKNDWVLIDECQDLNSARRELAKRMLKPGGRLIAVGDSRQAIYGFTGAGADSVNLIAQEFDCKRMPLTVTYRCPKAVVEYVHQWVSHIKAHDSAQEGAVITYQPGKCPTCNGAGVEDLGEVLGIKTCSRCAGSKLDDRAWFVQTTPGPNDAILCRYTKPLIESAYGMLRAGIACKVEGRDIGRGLIKLAQRWKVKSLDAYEQRLEKYEAAEIAKAESQDNETKRRQIEDKIATIRIFLDRTRAKGGHTIEALVAEIEALFADDVRGVCTLSTGHKAKGREWPRVHWLQAALRTRRPLQDWEAEQEANLNYVIGTRAQEALILIPEGLHSKG